MNITNCKIKKLENLVIPIKSFYQSERKDWHPEQPSITNSQTMEVKLQCGGGQIIEGILKNDLLTVTKMNISGEGSGSFRRFVLDESLKQSKGELEAILIWEGGEISKLQVKDGVIEENNVEL